MQPMRSRMVHERRESAQEVPRMQVLQVERAEAPQVRMLQMRACMEEQDRSAHEVSELPIEQVGPAGTEAAVPQMRIQVGSEERQELR